jgi:1-aminocyclopropane-1-carboxylate deaminase/D-cysteine desulfhydrase-like pyridoxal-dependent ACC family enzyme
MKPAVEQLWSDQAMSPCETINISGVSVVVKREDLNHQVVQGNKLRKLKYNFIHANKYNFRTIVTFGGAYSNHLLATAYAAKRCGFDSVGIVRGNELANRPSIWSETLYRCQQLGMQLEFVTRKAYREKDQSSEIKHLLSQLNQPFVIPEGGSNELALKGMAEVVAEIAHQSQEPTHIICPVGTGGTLAGLVQGVSSFNWGCKVLGVAVLKGLHDVKNDVNQWLGDFKNQFAYEILTEYHGGGYAKNNPELVGFCLAFEQQHQIKLDKVYNSKSFYALAQLIKSGQIKANDRPLIVHTGGLQGGVNK